MTGLPVVSSGIVVALASVWLQILLAPFGLAASYLPLVPVVLAGRRSPPGRGVGCALGAGLIAGVLHEGAYLAPAFSLLVVLLAVRKTRGVWALERLAGIGIYFGAMAVCYGALLAVLRSPGGPPDSWRDAVGSGWPGILVVSATGVLAERLFRESPRLRHAWERP